MVGGHFLTVNNVNDAPDENFYILTDHNGVFDALPSIVVDQDDPFIFTFGD